MRTTRVLLGKGSVVSQQKDTRDVRCGGVSSAGGLLGGLSPGKPGNKLLLGGIEVAEVDKGLDELWQSLIPEHPAHDGLRFGGVVKFTMFACS